MLQNWDKLQASNYTNETRTQEKKTENKCDIKSGSVVSILKLHKAALIVKTRKKNAKQTTHINNVM